MEGPNRYMFKSTGHCPTCDRDVDFIARDPWFRDHFVCSNCGSIPRERALMVTVDSYFPDWRNAVIHESSPGNRGASVRLANECPHYIPSHFFPDRPVGSLVGTFRCENLGALTFDDESIDIHITQDVMEHIFHPSTVFREIARTLRPGGMPIFTVPLVNKGAPSRPRARMEGDKIIHLEPESYHDNPVGDGRSLVTVDSDSISADIFLNPAVFLPILFTSTI